MYSIVLLSVNASGPPDVRPMVVLLTVVARTGSLNRMTPTALTPTPVDPFGGPIDVTVGAVGSELVPK